MTVKVFATPWVTSINQPDLSQNRNTQHGRIQTGGDGQDTSAANSESWTIKRLLDWTAQYFKEHGADQPRLDAEILLAAALNCQRIELYTRFEEQPTDDQRTKFRDWVSRHGAGEPVAYLVEHREFFSLKLAVSHEVLIPRPETEHLVSEAIDIIRQYDCGETKWIADVGTGSGNIAIAIAQHAPNARLVAVDISVPALEVAKRNAKNHGLRSAIDFVQSDLLTQVTSPAQFDLIASNPPYVGLDEKALLDQSVVDYEPLAALFSSGSRGTEIIERLVEQAAERLVAGGYLMFEMSPMIAGDCQQLIERSPLEFKRIVKDLAGLERVLIAQLPQP